MASTSRAQPSSSSHDEDQSTYVARELQIERERSKLDLEQLTNLIDGGRECTEKRRRMGKHYEVVLYTAPMHFPVLNHNREAAH